MLELQVSFREWAFRIVVAVVFVAVALLTWFGAGQYLQDLGVPWDWADQLYLTIQTFTLQLSSVPSGVSYPPALQIARFVAPVTLASGALLALAGLFRETRDRMRILLFFRGHIVVGGLGSIGSEAVRSLCGSGKRVVVIDRPGVQAIPAAREAGAVVITGDVRDPATWRQASVRRAAKVLVACGDDQTNGEAAMAACDAIGEGPEGGILVQVHLEDRNLVTRHTLESDGTFGNSSRLLARTFNLNESAAIRLLAMHPPFTLDPDVVPRVVIVGTCNLSRALLVQVARMWSLARLRAHRDEPLPLVLAAQDAAAVTAEMVLQLPDLDGLVRIEPYSGHLHAADLGRDLNLTGADSERVYVCLEDEAEGLAVALRLTAGREGCAVPANPVIVQARVTRGTTHFALGLPVEKGRGRADDFVFASLSSGAEIAIFAPLEVACEELTLFGDPAEQQARLAHDIYRGQRAAVREIERGPDDTSLRSWSDLEDDLRGSNVDQVAAMAGVWECVGVRGSTTHLEGAVVPAPIDPEELERLARREHQRWCRDKRRGGFMRGPARLDTDSSEEPHLTHPDLVPYAKLNQVARKKDRVAVLGYVLGLAALGQALPPRTAQGRLGAVGWQSNVEPASEAPPDSTTSATTPDAMGHVG